MTAAPATADVFAPIAGLVDEVDVMAGLEQLGRSVPLWPVSVDKWSEVVGALMAFERRFGDGHRFPCGGRTGARPTPISRL